jgi:hypothetical protein
LKLAIVFTLTATSALADYSTHKSVTPFIENPCTEVLAAIDTPETTIEAIAQMSMAWGFILGYDAASGGLHDGEQTTLVRLREACANNPETPITVLMDGFR